MANHVFATLRTFFNWALHRNVLALSPCAGIKKPTEEKGRERVLSDDEIRWLWRACEEINFPFGPITKLLVLTGARRNEVRAMLEGELDLRQRTWTIAATRSKNGLAHEIALTDAALTAIQSAPSVRNKTGYLFSTNGATPCSGFSRAKARLDKLMLDYARLDAKQRGDDPAKITVEPWRIHDLRRTVASGMARLGVALPVIEKCLNHISGSFAGIVGIYQRHTFKDEKRAAFEAWTRHVEAIVKDAQSTNIGSQG